MNKIQHCLWPKAFDPRNVFWWDLVYIIIFDATKYPEKEKRHWATEVTTRLWKFKASCYKQ